MARDKLTLDFLEPPQREYLRKQAEQRKCSVADVLRALVESDIETNRHGARERDPLDEIVGSITTDGKVTGENFHEYLYGRGEQE